VGEAAERFAELLRQLPQRKAEVAAAVAERRRRERAVTHAILTLDNPFRAEDPKAVCERWRAEIRRLESERDHQRLVVRALRKKMHRFYAELEDAKRTAKTGRFWS
jgi:hypothetical protein